MAPKVGSPVAVLKFLREHLAKHPEQGAAIMLAVQSGVYDTSTGKHTKFLSAIKRLHKVPDEFKIECMSSWLNGFTPEVWQKLQKAVYKNGHKNDQIIAQCFRFMTLTSEAQELPTRSRPLLKKLLDKVRVACAKQPKLTIQKNFCIDWASTGVYKLCGEEGGGEDAVYKKVRHNFLDIEVPLPKAIVLLKSTAVIKHNFDHFAAIITNVDGDFEKKPFDMLPAEAKKNISINNFLKDDAIKKEMDDAAAEIKTQSAGSASPSASTDDGAPAHKRRKLAKTLSDISVPEGSKVGECT